MASQSTCTHNLLSSINQRLTGALATPSHYASSPNMQQLPYGQPGVDASRRDGQPQAVSAFSTSADGGLKNAGYHESLASSGQAPLRPASTIVKASNAALAGLSHAHSSLVYPGAAQNYSAAAE